jgi:dienelactone hydrolase
MKITSVGWLIGGVLAATLPLGVMAQQQSQGPSGQPAQQNNLFQLAPIPPDIDTRKVDIYSAGTHMSGTLFISKSASAAQKLPTILMGHGWGGVAAMLRPEAVAFAQAGYLVLTFDYRGWGASDSRVILTKPAPANPPNHKFTAEVQEVREVVDPPDMADDWLAAINWVVGEPQCDANRIGLWGSSFSGGLVVWAAEHDHRVKAIHSQVGALDARALNGSLKDQELERKEATARARGEIGYPAPLAQVIEQLRGAPIRERFLDYAPGEDVNKAPDCAMQFIIAEKEELLDNRLNAIKAFNDFNGPRKNLVTVPGITHYGIYTTARQDALKLAMIWFDRYLKP